MRRTLGRNSTFAGTLVWNRTVVGTLVRNPYGNPHRNARETPCGNQRGFSLIEAVIAAALLIVTIGGLAPLFVQSARSAADGRRAPIVLAAASSKLEQLLALNWTYDAAGALLSDVSSDTSRDPPTPNGGAGLSASPGDSLSNPASGFVDYIDAAGRSVGSAMAPGAMFSRRWLIRPWPGAASDALLIRVCVVRITGTGSSTGGSTQAEPRPEVCLGTARVRR